MKILKEFKDYMTKDDILKSAGAFLIALTLRELILQFVKLVVNPLIALIFNIRDLSTYTVRIVNTNIQIGALFEAFLNFVVLSFTIFLIVKFSERTNLIRNKEKEEVIQLKKLNENMLKQIELSNKQLEILNNNIISNKRFDKKEVVNNNELSENDNIDSEEVMKSLAS